jgi:hypothetical protein
MSTHTGIKYSIEILSGERDLQKRLNELAEHMLWPGPQIVAITQNGTRYTLVIAQQVELR